MRTIRVTGKGQIRVRPDTTRITLSLEGREKEYGETLRRSSDASEALRDVLSDFGFARPDLKTLDFGVDAEYESYQDQEGVYRQRFAGYRFHHTLKVEFPSDNERLGRLLYALATCRGEPEFRISYTVKDPEAVKNALLGKAVSDAREKAAVLARAGGVDLKELQSIDYSWGQIDIEYRPMERMAKAVHPLMEASYAMDIEPDDIEISDTVIVIWEIE
jgi:uncharacterized protein YggE